MTYSDPSGEFNLVETMTTMAVAGTINAVIGIIFHSGEIGTKEFWGDVGKDFFIGAVTAPVGGFISSVFAPLFRASLAPVFRIIGRLDEVSMRGTSGVGRWLVRASRFFITTNKSYPPIEQTTMGSMLKRMFPKVEWDMHHVFIRQSWYRVGSKDQMYDDLLANSGLQRIGDALINILPMPANIHSILHSTKLAPQILATAYYSIITFGISHATGAFLSGDE